VVNSLKDHFQMTCGNPLLRDGDSCNMLGRTITRTADGYVLSGDEELAMKSIRELGLESAKPAPTPLSSSSCKIKDGDKLLDPVMHNLFRVHVGRLLYIAQDRIDLMFCAKHLARKVCSPTVADFAAVKRSYRYILGRPCLPYVYNNSTLPKELTVYSDSDWASCVESRKSTSGCIIAVGANIVHCHSRTQAVVALSSCEAELTAAVTAIAEALFLKSIFKDLSIDVQIHLLLDSKAALDHLSKLGRGKLKHIQIKSHYVQALVQQKLVRLHKVDGLLNVSDLLTKAVSSSTMRRLLSSSLINLDLSKYPFVDRDDEVDVRSVWSLESDQARDIELIKFVM